MRHATAAALAAILSLSAASAESRAEPPPAYEMKVVYLFDTPEPEILFVIGNSGFRTVESLKNFLTSVPPGTKLTWAPGCIRTGEGAAALLRVRDGGLQGASVSSTGSTSC